MKTMSIFLTALFTFALVNFSFASGERQSLTVTNSEFEIHGSANNGDWDCISDKTDGRLVVVNSDENSTMQSLEITIPAESFDCDNNRMNNSMYGYLKTDDHPNITYSLNRVHPGSITKDGTYMFYGSVTVAGVSKNIRTNVDVKRSGNGWVASGTQELKMTDFDIDPPTALFGAVRSQDEVNIKFSINFR